MAIKFSQFNERTDHTSGMYLVGYDGNQNIHITVDNLFDDFINGTENTIAMFGTDGTVLADSIITQSGTGIGVTGSITVTSDATFSTNIEVEGTADFNGNVNLGDESGDLITQNGTLYLNGPIKDTTDTLGATDQVLLSNATGELTFTSVYDLNIGSAETTAVPVKNVQGSALVKGDPVYISGSDSSSGILKVRLADASNAAKMPAVGLLKQDLADDAEGFAIVTGRLVDLITDPIDSSTPAENDIIYVKASGTSGAALTTTKPVYGNFIQNIGKVGRVSTSADGSFIVSSILRTNDIPNLTPGKLWVGSTGNTIESQTLFVDEANARLGIGTTSPAQSLEVAGNVLLQNTKEIRFKDNGGVERTTIKLNSNNDLNIGTSAGGNLIFINGSSYDERMRLESNGDFGIGTPNPSNRLHVKTDDQQPALFESTNTAKSMIVLKNADSANSIARLFIQDGRIVLGEDNQSTSRSNLKIQKQPTRTYSEAHMNLGGTGVSTKDKFNLPFRYDTADDDSYNGISIGGTITGTTALTADRGVNGINIDINSTAAGGNTSQELTLRGINIDVSNQTDGDANHLYGVFASAKDVRTGTGDNMTSITGGYFQAYSSAQTGQVSNMYGVEAITYIEDATHTVNNAYAVYGRTTIDNSFDDTISTRVVGGYFTAQVESGNDSQVPQSIGVYAENEITSNIDNIKGVEVISDINGGTTTNSYLIKGDVQISGGGSITNNWGLHLADVDKNYIDGTLGINNSNPTAQLVVRNSGVGNSVLKLEDSGGTQLLGVFEDSDGNAELSMRDGTGAMAIKFDTDGWSFINGGRLGIGTSTPSQTLEVAGNIQATSASGPQISAVYDADHYMRIEGNSSGGILKGADGGVITTLIRTYSDSYFNGGNVGIGTNSPTEKLEVNGDMAFTSENSSLTFGGVTSSPSLQITNSSSESNLTVFNRTLKLDSYDGIQFITGGYTNVFDTLGRLGLGTTTPANKLDVAGNIGIDESIIHNGDTDTKIGFVANDNFAITTAGSERVRVTSGGSVGIGTNNPASKLHVEGTAIIRNGNLQIDANPSTYPTTRIYFTKNNSTSPAMGEITMSDNPGFQGMMLTARLSSSPYTTSFIQIPTSVSKDFKINLLSNDVLTIGSSTKAVKFDGYIATAVSTSGSALSPVQTFKASTQDTLGTLCVDTSGNVVRGEQEATWTFTAAQLNGSLGMTLLNAPGANKAIIVTESDWMIKYNATGAISTGQNYEIRQESNVSPNAIISVLPGTRINEILSNSQGTPANPSYGFCTRDVPLQTRTYKTNVPTTLHKLTGAQLPSGVISISIKLKYRIFNATTF